jgi:tRNA threonylcarbamoyladenosine modification (KEOPS) complex  Pcc1 subunit
VEPWEMMAQASVRLKFKSREQLESVFKALEPETRAALTKRSKIKVSTKNGFLVLYFEAADTSALRAAMNSFLHWILLTRDVLESLEQNQV